MVVKKCHKKMTMRQGGPTAGLRLNYGKGPMSFPCALNGIHVTDKMSENYVEVLLHALCVAENRWLQKVTEHAAKDLLYEKLYEQAQTRRNCRRV